jgi:uncharacterized membrane protein
MTLLLTLKVLHIAAASVWMGGSLAAPGDIRHTLLQGPPQSTTLMTRLRRISRIMNQSALLTFVSGVALMGVIGFASTPHRIWLSVFLTLAAVAAGRWLIRPVLREIAQAISAPVAPAPLQRIMLRFHLVNGVEHALRLAVLVLMVFPFSF